MTLNYAYHPVLRYTIDHALAYLDSLASSSIAATATYKELTARLAYPLTPEGMPADQVIAELVRDTAGGLVDHQGWIC